MFVRICPYLPFSARVCLNQHHWLANRMGEEGIAFKQCDTATINGLTTLYVHGSSQQNWVRLLARNRSDETSAIWSRSGEKRTQLGHRRSEAFAVGDFGARTIEPHHVVPARHGREAVRNPAVAAPNCGDAAAIFRRINPPGKKS